MKQLLFLVLLLAVALVAVVASAHFHAIRLSATSAVKPGPKITNVTLNDGSTGSYTSGVASGKGVGTIAVTMSDGSYFNGTLSSSSNQFDTPSLYVLSNNNTPTCSSPTPINFNITAHPGAGASGSNYVLPVTVTCQPAGGALTIAGVYLNGGKSGAFTSGLANSTIGSVKVDMSNGSPFNGTVTSSNAGFAIGGSNATVRVVQTSGSPPTCSSPTPINFNLTASPGSGEGGGNLILPITVVCQPVAAVNLVQTLTTHGNITVTSPNQICTWQFNQPIASGDTVVGYIHTSDETDTTPMYPQKVTDNAGHTYNLTPGVTWVPFPEDIGIFYLTNIQGNPNTLYFDFSKYPARYPTLEGWCDVGFAEYSGAGNVMVVNPASSPGLNPSLTISPTAPARIWALASILSGIPGNMLNPGYDVILGDLATDEIGTWGSDSMVPAGNLTLHWSNLRGNENPCGGFDGNGCPSIVEAAAIQQSSGPPKIPRSTRYRYGFTSRPNTKSH